MQADVRIAVSSSTRIGFAGPQVILNTMCEQNQEKYDKECPPDFQSASYVAAYGQLDMVLNDDATPTTIKSVVGEVASLLLSRTHDISPVPLGDNFAATEVDMNAPFNYTRSRSITRPQVFLSIFTSDLHRLKISSATCSNILLNFMVMERLGETNVFVVVWPHLQ